MEQLTITPAEATLAKWTHEIFLINLVFNHIFVFCVTILMAKTYPYGLAIVPIASCIMIAYIEIKSRMIAKSTESTFVRAHWRIGAKRNRLFMLLFSITLMISFGGWHLSNLLHWKTVMTMALIGGVGLLPFMIALLILVVLGNDAVHQARNGKLPDNYLAKNPDL